VPECVVPRRKRQRVPGPWGLLLPAL